METLFVFKFINFIFPLFSVINNSLLSINVEPHGSFKSMIFLKSKFSATEIFIKYKNKNIVKVLTKKKITVNFTQEALEFTRQINPQNKKKGLRPF